MSQHPYQYANNKNKKTNKNNTVKVVRNLSNVTQALQDQHNKPAYNKNATMKTNQQ